MRIFPDLGRPLWGKILNIEEQAPGHYHWPDLDVDLTDEIILHPERFPLRARCLGITPWAELGPEPALVRCGSAALGAMGGRHFCGSRRPRRAGADRPGAGLLQRVGALDV